MELKEFVSETLQQILKGVEDAQQNIEASPGLSSRGAKVVGSASDRHLYQFVEFDIGVLVDESSKEASSGKAGIKVLEVINIGGGVSDEATTSTKTQNRIKFKVSLKLPSNDKKSYPVGVGYK
ncbi:hypothetical protein WJR50_32890 [Catalinimonas sp. 4WD22]|uniref:hypothetical protein n=1 Tax=Catalinimonas locisalis TaxID=3133978 RepID=UPI003100F109